MAVTERGAWTSYQQRGGCARAVGKSWVLAMLAPSGGCAWLRSRRRRRIWHASRAPARTMAGRDEGTGALIEPRNNQKQAPWSCPHDRPPLTVDHPMAGETEHASHTKIRILPFHLRPLSARVEDWRAGRPWYFDRSTSPAPATSHAACGFPALRVPICFMPRLMGPILPE
jgi:hypothetical protein